MTILKHVRIFQVAIWTMLREIYREILCLTIIIYYHLSGPSKFNLTLQSRALYKSSNKIHIQRSLSMP